MEVRPRHPGDPGRQVAGGGRQQDPRGRQAGRQAGAAGSRQVVQVQCSGRQAGRQAGGRQAGTGRLQKW